MKYKLFLPLIVIFSVMACDTSQQDNTLSMTVGGTGIPNTVGEQHFLDFQQAVTQLSLIHI